MNDLDSSPSGSCGCALVVILVRLTYRFLVGVRSVASPFGLVSWIDFVGRRKEIIVAQGSKVLSYYSGNVLGFFFRCGCRFLLACLLLATGDGSLSHAAEALHD